MRYSTKWRKRRRRIIQTLPNLFKLISYIKNAKMKEYISITTNSTSQNTWQSSSSHLKENHFQVQKVWPNSHSTNSLKGLKVLSPNKEICRLGSNKNNLELHRSTNQWSVAMKIFLQNVQIVQQWVIKLPGIRTILSLFLKARGKIQTVKNPRWIRCRSSRNEYRAHQKKPLKTRHQVQIRDILILDNYIIILFINGLSYPEK